MVKLSFHGGAGTVTGSKFLVEDGEDSVLIDCGMFQGRKEIRERNWSGPGFDAKAVRNVVLTHAHIDHSGYLPRLVKDGFRGPVYATPATADLADLLLRDSAMIQEEDAKYANKKGYSRHRPALPLYTVKDAERALRQFEVVDYGAWTELSSRMRFRYVPAGHILGSGMVELHLGSQGAQPLRCLFSGDLGRYDAPLVPDPSVPNPCDVLVVESTYGDRKHSDRSVEEQLVEMLQRIVATGGTALIPSFAVGRAQQLLLLLHRVGEAHPELDLPIHLDSPMAVNTTKIYQRYPEEKGLEAVDLRSGSSNIYGRNVYLHRTRDESMRLNSLTGPRVIVSSSGMLTGGRVLHHLRRLLPDEKNSVVLAGYQAPGTRGWRLQRGEQTIRVHGQDIPTRAHVTGISALSAHADADQILRWVEPLPAPGRTFVVHGESDPARELARRLEQERGHSCETPGLGDAFDLGQPG